MAVERKGFEYNGVLYQEMPDGMWQIFEKIICEMHGIKILEEEGPDDPPAPKNWTSGEGI